MKRYLVVSFGTLAGAIAVMTSAGCTVNADEEVGYSGSALGTIASLSSFGVAVTNGNQPLPSSWNAMKGASLKLSQAEHICPWASRPNIYAFTDGVVYADQGETNINVFSHALVRDKGCFVPPLNGVAVQRPFAEPLNPSNTFAMGGGPYEAASLAGQGIAVDNASHPRDGRFASIMGSALRLSQRDHACPWATRPLIYVFTDGIAYATVDGADFNVFSREMAKSKGCFVPDVMPLGSLSQPGTPAAPPAPAPPPAPPPAPAPATPPPPAPVELKVASATISDTCGSAVPTNPNALHVCLRFRSGTRLQYLNEVMFEFVGFSEATHEKLRNAVGLIGDALEINKTQNNNRSPSPSDWKTCALAHATKDFAPLVGVKGQGFEGEDVDTAAEAIEMFITSVFMILPKYTNPRTVLVYPFTEDFGSDGTITAGKALVRGQHFSFWPELPPLIKLNTVYLESNYFGARDVANTIFHEIGHQAGYSHPTGYEGSLIDEVGECIERDFSSAKRIGLVSKPRKTCD